MAKSPDAFRTISEVADWLGIQAHVLRFWESKFTQVKPIKRAGGRRYYRPADMLLLGGIKKLLHDDGLTIKGVQKILREEGMSHVVGMSAPLDELTMSQLVDAEKPVPTKPATTVETPQEEKGVVLNFEGNTASKTDEVVPEGTEPKEEPAQAKQDAAPPEPVAQTAEPEPKVQVDAAPEPEFAESKSDPAPEPEKTSEAAEVVDNTPTEPAQTEPAEPQDTSPEDSAPKDVEEPAPAAALPAFLRRPLAEQDDVAPKSDASTEPAAEEEIPTQAAEPEPTPPAPKKPRIITLPAFTPEADFPATAAALTSAFRARKIAPQNAAKANTLLRQLTALRDQMAARRRGATPPSAKD